VAEELVSKNNEQTKYRGLYKYVRIPVKTLDKIIVGLVIVLILVLVYALTHTGFTVTYDSVGGSDIEPVKDVKYGDYLTEPDNPQREGYSFEGWYRDKNLNYRWDFDSDTVTESMTLYASWNKE